MHHQTEVTFLFNMKLGACGTHSSEVSEVKSRRFSRAPSADDPTELYCSLLADVCGTSGDTEHNVPSDEC